MVNKWLVILLVFAIGGNLITLALVWRLWQHRKNAILAWSATEEWVGKQNQKALATENPEERPELVLLGASITQAFELETFFPDKKTINAGMNGQLSGQYLLRFKQDVINYMPQIVVIKLCAINITRDVPLQISYDNVIMMTQLATANGIEPVLASMIPITSEFDRIRSPKDITKEILLFNQWQKEFARQNGYRYLDYFTPLSDKKGYLKPAFSTDGMHLNKDGYEIMANELGTLFHHNQRPEQ